MPDGRTADDLHIDYGTGETIKMPDRFSAPDNGCTVSGTVGRMMGDEEQLIEQSETD